MTPYGNLDHLGHHYISSDGLFSASTKPLPQPMLTYIIICHSPEGNFTGNPQDIQPWCGFENYWFKSASSRGQCVQLAPRRFEQNFRQVIFKLISVTDAWGISCKIALRWMPLDLTNDKSTLVQVMAWCRQATSHYLSQCWPWFMSPYDMVSIGHKELIKSKPQTQNIIWHIPW